MPRLHSLGRLRACMQGAPVDARPPLRRRRPHSQIRAEVERAGVREGFVNVLSRHTTTAVSINENEARLLDDIRQFLHRLAPPTAPYLHNDLHYREAPPNWPGGWEAWWVSREGCRRGGHCREVAGAAGAAEASPSHALGCRRSDAHSCLCCAGRPRSRRTRTATCCQWCWATGEGLLALLPVLVCRGAMRCKCLAGLMQEPPSLPVALPNSETIPITEGKLALGTWQSVLLVELDGDRQRTVGIQVVGQTAGGSGAA